MENTWSFEMTNPIERREQDLINGAYQERDRRTRSIEITRMFMNKFLQIYPPMIAKEMLSALFRQRGVPSLDMFTASIIQSLKNGLGCEEPVEGTVRKIMSIGRWRSRNSCVTLWMQEPVLSSTIIRGNTVNTAAAKERFWDQIQTIEPLSMNTSNTTVVDNEIKGRWAGWLVDQEVKLTNGGNPICMSCNVSGSSFMFAVHYKGMRPIHMIMTPESIDVLASYAKNVCANMGMTSSMIVYKSTKLKIQAAISTGRATSLSIYGNGSMQISGSPKDIEPLSRCTLEIIKVVMDTEMIPFLKTMRRADVQTV